jgi:hypothetical protein
MAKILCQQGRKSFYSKIFFKRCNVNVKYNNNFINKYKFFVLMTRKTEAKGPEIINQ